MLEAEVNLTLNELWAIQGLVKALTVGDNGVKAVPGMVQVEETSVPAPLTLRRKVNSALLGIEDMSEKNATLSLTAEELWVIDGTMSREMGDWAGAFLLKIFRALEGLSLGIPLLTQEQAKQAHPGSDPSVATG